MSDSGSESGSDASWPDPETFLSQSFLEGKAWPRQDPSFSSNHSIDLNSSTTPRSAKVRIHKSGSVSVVSDDMTTTITPRHDRGRASLQVLNSGRRGRGISGSNSSSASNRSFVGGGAYDLYENYNASNFGEINVDSESGLGSNWRSAIAVSSLHQAYSRAISENRSLKSALAASESRCAELLQLSDSVEQKSVDASGGASEKEVAELRHELERREDELAKLKDELAQAQQEKLELIKWEERAAVERAARLGFAQGSARRNHN